MGNRTDKPALQIAETASAEMGITGHTVGTVAIEVAGSRSIQFHLLAMKNGHRDGYPVRCRYLHSVGRIILRSVASGHPGLLEHHLLERPQINLKCGRWGDRRIINEVQQMGVIFDINCLCKHMNRLRKFHRGGFSIAPSAYADLINPTYPDK